MVGVEGFPEGRDGQSIAQGRSSFPAASLKDGTGSLLCGLPFVAVVQPADLAGGDDLPLAPILDFTTLRAIHLQREVGSRTIVVLDIRFQDTSQMALVEDDQVIQAFSSNTAV